MDGSVPFYHFLHSVQHCFFIFRIIRNQLIPSARPLLTGVIFIIQIHRSMTLIICFIDHEKSVFITHLIKHRCIRIVAGADCIDIMPLHQLQILLHLIYADGKSCYRIGIMAVHTAELHRCPIDIDDAVLDMDLSDSDIFL